MDGVGKPVYTENFVLHGKEYSRGDQIVVGPSAPRHRDGFLARVMRARVEDGVVTEVDVFGAPGTKAPCVRTIRPERLTHVGVGRKRRKTEEAP